jgi:prepilin-type N-terminal cleavage/methylation domain-containing protein
MITGDKKRKTLNKSNLIFLKGGIHMLKKRNQKGFTLIEIIAVLVILGILAAVAIPKYLDLQNQANERALTGALAEGMSTVSMQYARLSLSFGHSPLAASVVAAANANKPGTDDFTYTFTEASSNVDVKVNWKPAKTGVTEQTKLWTAP